MSSSVSYATTRTISMYSQSLECALKEDFLRSKSRLDASTSSYKYSDIKLSQEERRCGHEWLELSSVMGGESKACFNSSMAPSCELNRPVMESGLALKKTRTMSSCRAGYWITSDADFVVLDLSWEDS